MHKLWWVCATLLLAIIPCAATSSKPTLDGTVKDVNGAALSKSLRTRVLVHWDPSGADVGLKSNVGIKEDLSLETDSHGTFEAALPPGFYDIFVSAMGFVPKCEKIRIQPHKVVKLSVKLEVDKTVMRELADRPF